LLISFEQVDVFRGGFTTPPLPPLEGEGDPLPDIEGKMIIERHLFLSFSMKSYKSPFNFSLPFKGRAGRGHFISRRRLQFLILA